MMRRAKRAAGVFDVIAPIGPAPNDMKDCEESPTARLGVELDAFYQVFCKLNETKKQIATARVCLFLRELP
jgi:hypothetical protein